MEDKVKKNLLLYKELITKCSPLEVEEKLTQVNLFFNNLIPYVSDLKAHGVSDYWQSLYETLSLGTGDCDDYAIAKYITLKKLGVGVKNMFLGYVFTSKQEAHLVLFVKGKIKSSFLGFSRYKDVMWCLDNRYQVLHTLEDTPEYQTQIKDIVSELDIIDDYTERKNLQKSMLTKLLTTLRREEEKNYSY